MDSECYILDGDDVRAVDLGSWVEWFAGDPIQRLISLTIIDPVTAEQKRTGGQADIKVSTVFLGIDHRFGMAGPPILFETMVFGGLLDQEQMRYATMVEARAGHVAMVARVKMAEAGKSIEKGGAHEIPLRGPASDAVGD